MNKSQQRVLFIAAPIVILFIILLVVYMCSDHRRFRKAVSYYRNEQFKKCLHVLTPISDKNRQSSRFVYLTSDCQLNMAREHFQNGRFNESLKCLDSIHGQFQKYQEVAKLKKGAQTKIDAKRVASVYAQACTLFNNKEYHQSAAMLTDLRLPNNHPYNSKVAKLKKALEYHFQIEKELPMNPIVKQKGVLIQNISAIPVNQGLVKSIDLRDTRRDRRSEAKYKRIYLRNLTHDKVKPDVQVLILNKDGVIVFKHSESWLINTLDYNQSKTVYVDKQIQFPSSLVFSKWALLGWDIKPKYALCVGSKTAYDRLKQNLVNEFSRIQTTPHIIIKYPYNIKDILPEVLPFSFGQNISTRDSTIVESVSFSQSEVTISYWNRSDMRIKPNIKGYIFNKDGVIISSFQDSWTFLSLEPDEQKAEAKSISFSIPDGLVFSRWARTTYDVSPTWFLLAGSSKQFHDLICRTKGRIKALNEISLAEE